MKSSLIKINRCIDDPKLALLDEEQEKTRKQKQRYFGSCMMQIFWENVNPRRYERVLKNLHSKEDDSSKFFSDFNPMCDRKTKKLRRRPRKKAVEKMKCKKHEEVSEEPVNESEAQNPASEKASVYDSKGVLIHSGLDLCDCLEDSCPGCHLPCSNCTSPKCGHLCRSSLGL